MAHSPQRGIKASALGYQTHNLGYFAVCLSKICFAQTLRTLCQWIDAHPDVEFSTDELAAAVNISRVSCRKYLIWLAQINILYTTIHYGATGRPVYRYRLVAEQYSLLKQYSQ